MSDQPSDKPFFIGYLPAPEGLRLFLLSCAVSILAFFAVTGVILGLAQDAPESAGAVPGRQTVTGVVETLPYPILHIQEGTDALPAGRTILLSGQGKNGAIDRAEPIHSRLGTASGLLLKRGDLDMLQLRGGQRGLDLVMGDPDEIPQAEPLGRWRLAGEICDGKCLAGAMRPGRGLAHKACAILCIDGGIPPVFVSTQPVEGAEFLLITGPGGTPLPPEAERHMAQYISIEGDISRHGTLLVFEIDPNTIEVLP